jgi:hypothetical protein
MKTLSWFALISCIALIASAQAPAKLEAFLMLPEPTAMRNGQSRPLGDSQRTVLTPAREIALVPGVETYGRDEFVKLGISPETFLKHATAAAEARLAKLTPEFIKDNQGHTLYAVYRGESPLIASLIIAPSLTKLVSKLFGNVVWAALPDRHSLYLFPAKQALVEDFLPDLRLRFRDSTYPASNELFLLQPGKAPKAIASFEGQ